MTKCLTNPWCSSRVACKLTIPSSSRRWYYLTYVTYVYAPLVGQCLDQLCERHGLPVVQMGLHRYEYPFVSGGHDAGYSCGR